MVAIAAPEGPACQVRSSEGRACRVREIPFDDRSYIRGHDGRAPPNSLSEGRACRVRPLLFIPPTTLTDSQVST